MVFDQNQAGGREGEPLGLEDVVQVERTPGAGDSRASGNGGFKKGRGDVVTIQEVGMETNLCDQTRVPSQVWLGQRQTVGGQKCLGSPTRQTQSYMHGRTVRLVSGSGNNNQPCVYHGRDTGEESDDSLGDDVLVGDLVEHYDAHDGRPLTRHTASPLPSASIPISTQQRVEEAAEGKCWLCGHFGGHVARVIAGPGRILLDAFREQGLIHIDSHDDFENLIYLCSYCQGHFGGRTPVWVFLPTNLDEFIENEEEFQRQRMRAADAGYFLPREPFTVAGTIGPGTSGSPKRRKTHDYPGMLGELDKILGFPGSHSNILYTRYQTRSRYIPGTPFNEYPDKRWWGNPIAAIIRSASIVFGIVRSDEENIGGMPANIVEKLRRLLYLYRQRPPAVARQARDNLGGNRSEPQGGGGRSDRGSSSSASSGEGGRDTLEKEDSSVPTRQKPRGGRGGSQQAKRGQNTSGGRNRQNKLHQGDAIAGPIVPPKETWSSPAKRSSPRTSSVPKVSDLKLFEIKNLGAALEQEQPLPDEIASSGGRPTTVSVLIPHGRNSRTNYLLKRKLDPLSGPPLARSGALMGVKKRIHSRQDSDALEEERAQLSETLESSNCEAPDNNVEDPVTTIHPTSPAIADTIVVLPHADTLQTATQNQQQPPAPASSPLQVPTIGHRRRRVHPAGANACEHRAPRKGKTS
ncbi:MAG: hypothetical protein M1839_008811 [Geoglossum umbratile]|nr:MAG: hypothetical protein M1839_008811 [Geoglossum umbratile]